MSLLGAAAEAQNCIPGTRWYVDASTTNQTQSGYCWAEAFTDLQSALTAANAGDEIWMTAGTYTPTAQTVAGDPRSVTFLLDRSLQVYGGFLGTETLLSERPAQPLGNPSILSGAIGTPATSDDAYHVVRVQSPTGAPDVLLDGIEISYGNATGAASTGNARDDFGGGILLDAIGSSPFLFLDKCRITSNISNSGGSGLAMFGRSGLSILRSEFLYNGIPEQAPMNVQGGAIYSDRGRIDAVSCLFLENAAGMEGGALYLRPNTQLDGMGKLQLPPHRFVNCLFALNSAGTNGGAAYVEGSTTGPAFGAVRFGNTTMYANTSSTSDSVFAETTAPSPAVLEIYNCVVRWNESGTADTVVAPGADVRYSDVQMITGPFPGTGNIDVDPQFTSVNGGDFTGAPGSPINDAGQSSLMLRDFFDLDTDSNFSELLPLDYLDRPRLMDDPLAPGATVDMGAFENQGA